MPRPRPKYLALVVLWILVCADIAYAAPRTPRIVEGSVVDTLDAVEVTDTFERQPTRFNAASQGSVPLARLRLRPVLRSGEMLETVPGVVISQHSGEGKANQYYLRGFNLDHGTDFATTVAGIPVNMPTHGHGQGYSDLNFVIPELVGGVEYRKGPYFAEEGDFAAAGAAHITYLNTLERPIAELSYGRYGYHRGLFAASSPVGHGDLLYAFEYLHNDGPWVHPDGFQRLSGVLRYGRSAEHGGYRMTAMGYDGRWNSTDQIPERAVESGGLSRFGAIDPSDAGRSHRYSLSGEWLHAGAGGTSRATAYAMDYKLNLFSNFTYFLDDPVNGDQFEQADDRFVSGLGASHSWSSSWAGHAVENAVGLQVRNDLIRNVGLYHTVDRVRISTTRQDHVTQLSASPYVSSTWQWATKARTTFGLRADRYWFDVRSDRPENSGETSEGIVSPKFGLVLGPWAKTAWFLNAGTGFHSNDARGATITADPSTGDPVARVDPLVRATGGEVGVRTLAVPGLQSSLSLWVLDIDSELLFIGDAGSTEASRPSRRLGVEWSNVLVPLRHVTLDADLAFSRARFRDSDPVGDHIPGAVEGVVAAGATVDGLSHWSGSLRLRVFGPRPLIDDNSVRSQATTLLNAQVGYRVAEPLRLTLEGFNLLNQNASDIDYYYASRLPGEPAEGVDDIHTHPHPPRTLRFGVTGSW